MAETLSVAELIMCPASMCIGNMVKCTVSWELFVRLRVCCECAKMRAHYSTKINKDLASAVFSKVNAL